MGGGVDLHAHTTASDGTLPPAELVRVAVRRGVRVLAITDHDTTDGVPEAAAEARCHPPLELVPGLEINCDVPGSEVHVLGYCLDWEEGWLQAFLADQRAQRRARVVRIAERLTDLGMPIDPEEVFALVGGGAAGRPHVAQVMMRRGYVKSIRQAFDAYLHEGGSAYVPRHRLTPAEAVAVIRRARGVPVLAHPGVAERDDLLPALVTAGLQGIECYHPEHTATQVAHYRARCREHGLVETGGSDYHGPRRGRSSAPGSPPVPLRVWHALRERAGQCRD